MIYEKPEMELIVLEGNVYMTLSLEQGGNSQGGDDDDDMNVDF